MTAYKLTDAERVAFAADSWRGCTPRPAWWRLEDGQWWQTAHESKPWREFYDGEHYCGNRSGPLNGPDHRDWLETL